MNKEIHLATHEGSETMSPELLQRLRSVSILSSLPDDQLSCLQNAEQIHVEKGDFVARQGEITTSFWILLKGEVQIFQTQGDGREVTFATVSEGHTFGEVPLLAKIPNAVSVRCNEDCELLTLNEDEFWDLLTSCPEVRKAILGNMAARLQKMQSMNTQQEKMASLGTLAAGLMHELNNPGAAASRAASQLRANLLRMHELSAKFSRMSLSNEQKQCMIQLQSDALGAKRSLMMNSLEQSDAEEALAEWMEAAQVENAWKLAPTLVSIGITAERLECAKSEFQGELLSVTLSWLEAMVSSMQLVGTIEESIGRVSDLVRAVKSYAYEGKGQVQKINVNDSIHATMVILAHKMREKEIVVEKEFGADLPLLSSACSGVNQIWTNLLDNAIDAVPQGGRIGVRTWMEKVGAAASRTRTDLCISVTDNGSGIPLEIQEHIFDPFYTTKAVGVGTGLGLGIIHRIVEQFDGTIRFSSDQNGTTFVVRLPVGDA
jgi:signal transduction histidine kinase